MPQPTSDFGLYINLIHCGCFGMKNKQKTVIHHRCEIVLFVRWILELWPKTCVVMSQWTFTTKFVSDQPWVLVDGCVEFEVIRWWRSDDMAFTRMGPRPFWLPPLYQSISECPWTFLPNSKTFPPCDPRSKRVDRTDRWVQRKTSELWIPDDEI